MNTVPIPGVYTSRTRCWQVGCHRFAVLDSRYCLEDQIKGNDHSVEADWRQRPVPERPKAYIITCSLCARTEFKDYTDSDYKALRKIPPCEHCGAQRRIEQDETAPQDTRWKFGPSVEVKQI